MKKVFSQIGTNFEACHAAEQWCSERGIAVGAMERAQPRGLLLGHFQIAKWRNLDEQERCALDGTMMGDMRNGPVVIMLIGDESAYPIVEPVEAAENGL